MKEKTFWLEDFEGVGKGGFYIRNDLFKFFKCLESQGHEPVGIKIDDSWNLHIIIKEK